METPEIQPEAERTEPSDAPTESQRLADATFEPEAAVEQTSDFQQAEAIETAFVQAVEQTAAAGVETEATMLPVPTGEGEGEGRLLVASMEGVPETVSEPLTPPPEESIQADSSRLERSSGEGGGPQEAIPISIPGVQMAGGGVEGGSEQAVAIPTSLPFPRPEGTERAPESRFGPAAEAHLPPDPDPFPRSEIVAEGLAGSGGETLGMDHEPPPPPDLVQMESLPGAPRGGSEEVSPTRIPPAGGIGPMVLEGQGVAAGGEQAETLPIPTPYPTPEMEVAGEMPAAPIGEAAILEGSIPEGEQGLPGMIGGIEMAAAEIAEGETWSPPEVYMHYNQDGTATVVDASGNPVANPPLYGTHDGQNYYAYYPGFESQAWDLPSYRAPLQQGWCVYTAQDGTLSVVDAKGNPVSTPPLIDTHDGQNYYAYYPGSNLNDPASFVDLPHYQAPLQQGWYVYTAQDGTLSVVDANGNAVSTPPLIDTHDGQNYYAHYPGSDANNPASFVDLPHYQAPLQQGWYVYTGQDGTLKVVDSNGNPVASPPVIDTHDGQNYYASYPGSDLNNPASFVDLPPYIASMPKTGWYVLTGQDGSLTVVDGNGKPVASPPIVDTHDGQNYYAYYPGSNLNDAASFVDLQHYTAPLQDVYLHVGQDGKTTVVDSQGKPLACQPLIGTHDGINYYAYYRGDLTQTSLTYYRPPSSQKAGAT